MFSTNFFIIYSIIYIIAGQHKSDKYNIERKILFNKSYCNITQIIVRFRYLKKRSDLLIFLIIFNALDNDERDFITVLYEKHSRKMLAYARSVLHNEQDALDALDDIFIKIMQDIEKFMQCDSDKTAALIIIYSRGVLFNKYRKKKTENKIFTSMYYTDENGDEIETVIEDSQPTPDELLITKETVRLVEESLRSLKGIDQDIIKLAYYYHYRQKDIAGILGISETNINTRILRIKEKLNKYKGGELYDRI